MTLTSVLRSLAAAVWVMAFCALAACGDKPQTAGTSSKKHDVEAFSGGSNTAFAAPGWKPGDEASWEQQMKARNQNQNEYTRTR